MTNQVQRGILGLLLGTLILCLDLACSPSTNPADQGTGRDETVDSVIADADPMPTEEIAEETEQPHAAIFRGEERATPVENPTQTAVDRDQQQNDGESSLADLLVDPDDREVLIPAAEDPFEKPVSDTEVTTEVEVDAPEMRQLRGRHIVIYTDLPSSAPVDELTLVFDQAVARWARYFGIRPVDKRVRDFKMTAYVIRAKERFQIAGVFPNNLPPFLHGYQRGKEFWIYEQRSDYYLRHIFLHEGTHGFMNLVLGGAGPPWYMEGVAELLATHRWEDGVLTLGHMPRSREEVPYWGRIKIIKDDFAAGRALMIQNVLRTKNQAFLEVEPYAWCWAAAAFLDGHPSFQKTFRALRNKVHDRSIRFTRSFEQQLISQLRELDEQWQLFVMNVEYGYDFERAAVQYRPGKPVPVDGAKTTVAADRGWQSSGYRLESGQNYRVSAEGRYQLATEPKIWWCEPGGVTLRYYQSYPLGALLGNVRLDEARPGVANLGSPVVFGRNRLVKPEESGTLYLKINDSAAELADNSGQLTVEIQPLPAADPN